MACPSTQFFGDAWEICLEQNGVPFYATKSDKAWATTITVWLVKPWSVTTYHGLRTPGQQLWPPPPFELPCSARGTGSPWLIHHLRPVSAQEAPLQPGQAVGIILCGPRSPRTIQAEKKQGMHGLFKAELYEGKCQLLCNRRPPLEPWNG